MADAEAIAQGDAINKCPPGGSATIHELATLLARDVTRAHVFTPELVPVFRAVYERPREHWEAYETCEELVDLEDNFQLWRFRHMKTVERIMGYKRGTGGSSGVGYLRSTLDKRCFPELWGLRSHL